MTFKPLKMGFDKWYYIHFDTLKEDYTEDNLDTMHTDEDGQNIEQNANFQYYCVAQWLLFNKKLLFNKEMKQNEV